MMRWIVSTSQRCRRAVVAAAIVVLVAGVWQLREAKLDALPEFSPPTVQVQTEALGLSAEEVEQLITVPLEQDLLDGLPWLETMRSQSVPSLSSIELIFERGTDLYRARQAVQERLSQAAGLPNVSNPPQMLQPLSSTSRTMLVSLTPTSPKLSAIDIGVLARWIIRPRLLAVPGVANVAIWGQRERQLQVQVDPAKLRDKGVSLAQVVASTGNALWVSPLTFLEASTPGTGGFIDTANQRLGIQHRLPITSAGDLAGVVVEGTTGSTVRLGDVATVVLDHQPLIGDAVVSGTGTTAAPGFLLAVEKLPHANTQDVTADVEAALQQLQPALGDLAVDPTVFRPAGYVEQARDNVIRSLLIGGVLAAAVIAVFAFSWRSALVSIAAFVLSYVVALLVLHLTDTTVNVIIGAGLAVAIGAVVNDAVASTQGVATALRSRHDRSANGTDPAPATVALRGALQAGRLAVYATLILAVALLPLFFMNGLAGDRFLPTLAGASLVALVASLLVSLVVTPALTLLLVRKGTLDRREPPSAAWLRRTCGRVLPAVAQRGWLALGVLVVVGAAGIVVGARSERELLPSFRDRDVLVAWQGAPGTSLPEMDRITGLAAAELRTLPGVRNVGTHVGRAILGDQAVGSETASMWLSIDPSAEYRPTLAAIERVVAGYPGLRHDVLTYTKQRIDEALAGPPSELTVRVFGTDMGEMRGKAGEIQQLIEATDGVSGTRVDPLVQEPTMEIEVDLAKAKDHGIKPGDVRRAAATLLSGLQVGSLFEQQKVFDVQVWSTPETRHSLSNVQDLMIDTPGGGQVRLADIATVRVRPTLSSIKREEVSRYLDVHATVSGRDVGSVARSVRQQLAALAFPAEYHAEVLGEYAAQQDAQRRSLGLAVGAAIGIFLLLQAAFASWRLAFVIFLALPAALSGGVFAAAVTGEPLSLATTAGYFALLAVAVRGGLAVAGAYVDRLPQPGQAPHARAVDAARTVVTPVVATALATGAAVLPFVFTGDVAGQELLQPFSIVVLGGLVTSTLVTVVGLPALCAALGPKRVPEEMRLTVTEPAELATVGGEGR